MQLAFAIPDLAQSGRGGGAEYVAALADAFRTLGHHVDLGPRPLVTDGAVLVIDGMLLPDLRPELDRLIAADAVALIHHVSAAAGRDDGERSRILSIESEMIPRLRRIVATSEPVAARLRAEFGVEPFVLPPGVRDRPRATPEPGPLRILSVGVLTRRKGHDRLLRIVARLTDLPWRLVIAGDGGREPDYETELAALIRTLDLHDRVELLPDPSPDAIERAWSGAAVFALATNWEGYPAAIADALRRGIPIVTTTPSEAGKFVPADAGIFVAPDDEATFGKCLRRLLFDGDLRRDMADAAWQAGRALPSWTQRAEEFVAFLEMN